MRTGAARRVRGKFEVQRHRHDTSASSAHMRGPGRHRSPPAARHGRRCRAAWRTLEQREWQRKKIRAAEAGRGDAPGRAPSAPAARITTGRRSRSAAMAGAPRAAWRAQKALAARLLGRGLKSKGSQMFLSTTMSFFSWDSLFRASSFSSRLLSRSIRLGDLRAVDGAGGGGKRAESAVGARGRTGQQPRALNSTGGSRAGGARASAREPRGRRGGDAKGAPAARRRGGKRRRPAQLASSGRAWP